MAAQNPNLERAFGVTNIKLHISIILDLDNHNYNQFRNNKETRVIQLDNELRTFEIGDQSIQVYCHKIKSLTDFLANVNALVPKRTLVMYLLNGLNDKFDYIINVIKQKDPFISFDVAKNMLEMEESRLNRLNKITASQMDHSSSSIALTITNNPVASAPTRPPNQLFNNNRGRWAPPYPWSSPAGPWTAPPYPWNPYAQWQAPRYTSPPQ